MNLVSWDQSITPKESFREQPRAEPESIQKETEPPFRFPVVETDDPEHSALKLGFMYPDRSGSQLHSVAYQIVEISRRVTGTFLQ